MRRSVTLGVLACLSVVATAALEATPSGASATASTTSARQDGFAVSVQLLEDTNGNAVIDANDSTPSDQTIVSLVPWASPFRSVVLITGEDGRFTFSNIPPGDYTMRLYWPAGFAEGLAPVELPHILRAVFRVTSDGTLETPDPLPATWPGLREPFDPVSDRTLMGYVPETILLVGTDPFILPTDSGVDFDVVGSVDVAAALQRLAGATLPTPAITPVVVTDAVISSQLVVDTNDNGVVDRDDRTAVRTLVELIFWSNIPEETSPQVSTNADGRPWYLSLYTADDGSFSFTNLPVGNYTVQIWWAGGFVNGGSDYLPDKHRAALRVNADGSISPPVATPATWPESFGNEPFEPVKDRVILGALPPQILLKPALPNVVPYPVDTGGIEPVRGGVIDVGALFTGRAAGLPPTGSGSGSLPEDAAWFVAFGALLLAAGGLVIWRRG